jgi:hypothetical protein
VHAVDGSVASATDGRFIDEPSSFYDRLTPPAGSRALFRRCHRTVFLRMAVTVWPD